MKLLKKLYPKAKKYMQDRRRLIELISKSFKKLSKLKDKEKRKELAGDFYVSCELVREWANGTYRTVPTGSILKIIVGILYFIMPIDLIPDFIVGTGLLDDITIISYLLASLKDDLELYKKHKLEEKNDNNLTKDIKQNNIVIVKDEK